MERFVYLLWKVDKGMDEGGNVLPDIVPPVPALRPATLAEPPAAASREEAPQKMYVKTDDSKVHGYTLGCQAANSSAWVPPEWVAMANAEDVFPRLSLLQMMEGSV